MPPSSSINSNKSSDQWLTSLGLVLSVLIPVIIGVLFSLHSLGELDIWFHYQSGQDILSNHTLSDTNDYSFNEPDHLWTNHEWLFQILIAPWGANQGDPGPMVNHWVLLRVVLTLVLLAILFLGVAPWRAPPILLIGLSPGLLLGVFLLWTRLLIRPELISFIFLVLFIRVLDKDNSLQSTASWFSRHQKGGQLFIIALLWAQFHGFSALTLGLLLLAIALSLVPFSQIPKNSLKNNLIYLSLIILALFLTPNFWQGLIYPVQAISQFTSKEASIHTSISELQPLLQSSNGLYLTLIAFKISLIWGLILILLFRRKISFLRISLWLGFAAATFAAQRNLGFYAISFLLLHTGFISRDLLKTDLIIPAFFRRRWLLSVPVLLVLFGAGWLVTNISNDQFYLREGQSRRFGTGATPARYPFEAVNFLARNPGQKVFTNIDASSLTLSLGQSRVFIDGRTEAYSPHTWSFYNELRKVSPGASDAIIETGAKKVLLTLGSGSFHPLLNQLLADEQWQILNAESAGILLQKTIQPARVNGPETLRPFVQLISQKPLPFSEKVRIADLLGARATLARLAAMPQQEETLLIKGLSFCPTHPLLNHNLGNIYLAKSQWAMAFEHFKTALEMNPRLSGSAMNAGVCQMKLEQFSEAQKLFKKACSLEPGNYQYWANYSLALEQNRQFKPAFEAMIRAAELAPGNPALQRALQKLKRQL
ncbi:MAG: hypothetical protein GY780_08450 [bacterium]|nr:hypothetical protein [bacterium]